MQIHTFENAIKKEQIIVSSYVVNLSPKKFCMKIPSLSISRRYISRFNFFDTNFIQPTSNS